MNRITLTFDAIGSVQQLIDFCGPMDENLLRLAKHLNVRIIRRGEKITVTGTNDAVEQALSALATLFERTGDTGQPLTLDVIDLYCLGDDRQVRRPGKALLDDVELKTRRHDLQGRTPNQRQYLQQILKHDLTLGVGPAGTGKTFLAVACAVDAFERGLVERIILTRPAVEAGERLGFLPGDLTQKVDPYLRPLYDALFDLMGFDKAQRLMERQTIEVAPLAYMRGRTLNNAFVILDEAQNTTCEQMKMFLTRIGFGTKAVVTGDVTQVDLPKGMKSGLKEALTVLKDVRGIAQTHFTAGDVVRHPLVAKIVQAYERHQADEDARPRRAIAPRQDEES